MTSQDSLVGRTISNKYRVLSHIGSGAMGSVYLAEHTSIQKRVALKILHSDLNVNDDILRRFQQEGIAAGKFSHPNAIQIFDFDKDGEDIFYLAMEYVEGTSLKDLLEQKGAQPFPKAIHITRQVLSALGEAHKQGIIHRDLKPENIMVTDPESETPGVKILDFGISKLMDFSGEQGMHTQTGRIMGTPYYMAPEQFSGETVDHRSDIFATGLVLFELLAGKRPFQGETVSEILFKHAVEETPPVQALNPDLPIPKGLNEIVAKASEKKPADRYQSALEMVHDLDRLDPGKLDTKTKIRTGVFSSSAAGASRRPSPVPKILLGLGVVAIAIGLGVFLPGLFDGLGSGGDDVPRVSMKDPAHLSEPEKTYLGHLERARTDLATGKTLEAINAANLALRMGCKDSEGYLVRGLAYLQKRDLDTALPDFEESLKLDPDFAEAVAALGSVHLERGELKSATVRFEQAAELDPELATAIAGQGIVRFTEGRLTEAEEKLTRAVELDPSNALSHLYLGKIYLSRGDVELAGPSFIQAKRNDATLWEAYFSMGQVYELQGKTEEAEQQYRDAIKIKPKAVDAENALAAILLDRDRHAEALAVVDTTLQHHPESGDAHLLRGVIQFQQDLPEQAVASLEEGMRRGAENSGARSLLGILYQQAGRYREALDQFRKSVQIEPDQSVIYQNIGVCLIQLARYEEARDALEKSIMLGPDRSYPHYALGLLYMDFLEDEDGAAKAVESFTQYRENGGSDPRVISWIGELEQ